MSPNSAWCPACGAKLFSAVPAAFLIGIVALILLALMCVALAAWALSR